jgi:hypothetical protein
MLKMLQLPTPNGSPEATPRQNHGQEGGSNTQSTVHSSAALRTAAEMHSGCSDDEDDSSDSDDESFVSSQHAIKARSVRSAQKGGPVTTMSSRGSRPNAPSFSSVRADAPALPANGDTPVPSLLQIE